MATVQQTLRNPLYRNWVKGGLVLQFTRDGIQCFVDGAIQDFQQKCLNDIWARKCLLVGTVCNMCTTQNVLPCPTRGTCTIRYGVCNYHDNSDPLKTHRPCPSGICNDLQDTIYKSHRFRGPSWNNTNAQLWCSNSWEIAKCFMAASGYSTVTSVGQTDFPGLVSVVTNLKDLQNMVADNLSRQNNLFCQARNIRNDILHTATFELTDTMLNGYIDTMINLLNDPGYLVIDGNAKAAIIKLNQVKTDSLTVTNEDERKIREQAFQAIDEKKEEAIKHIQEEENEAISHIEEKKNTSIQELKNEAEVIQEKENEAIIHIEEKKNTSIQELRNEAEVIQEKENEAIIHIEEKKNTGIQELMNEAKVIQEKENEAIIHIEEKKKTSIQELKNATEVNQEKERQAYIKEKQDLQLELIKVYREDFIKESIFPQRQEEQDTDIDEIYVEPHIELVDLQSKWENDESKNKTVHAYKDIFYKESCEGLCKKIYMTGKAGMGKTTFCKKLMSSWCNAHSMPSPSQMCNDAQSLSEDNIAINKTSETNRERTKSNDSDTSFKNDQVMLKFPFLFYVSLRHSKSTSEIEDMIKDQLLTQKKHKSLLDYILEREPEQCLIILDGLDEWSPPKGHCHKLASVTKFLPARSTTTKCSILTTTRPWKLEVLRLRTPEIDQQVECSGIDEKSANEYIRSVTAILNRKTRQEKNHEDFEKELNKKNLNDLKTIPVMLKQLICLWHAGKRLDSSKCAIYSEMINLMFELAKTRLENNLKRGNIKGKSQKVQISLPKCFDGVKLCQKFSSLIYSLSNLSFKTLMKNKEDSALVFDSSEVGIYGLSESEIIFCLEVGILSQSKVISTDCTRQKSFSFIHKTFQEFLAAVFVSIRNDSSSDIVETICSKINTVEDVFQQSEFLVFMSGMCPEILYKLTEHICRLPFVAIKGYSSTVTETFPVLLHPGENLQLPKLLGDLMTQCLLESKDNGYQNIEIKLEGIYINGNVIKKITPVIDDANRIKSVYADTRNLETIKDIKGLQRLFLVNKLVRHNQFTERYILIIPEDTLTTLSLFNNVKLSKFPKILNSLRHLTGLSLDTYTFDHDDSQLLYEYVTHAVQLQYIHLCQIYCSNCDSRSSRQHLDLSNHQQLKYLHLYKLSYLFTVVVNNSKLEHCQIDMNYVEGLKCAPNLKYLICHVPFTNRDLDQITLPPLVQLKDVVIEFGGRELLMPPEMKNLERLTLRYWKMTSRAVCRFVDSIPHTQNSVTVSLELSENLPMISSLISSFQIENMMNPSSEHLPCSSNMPSPSFKFKNTTAFRVGEILQHIKSCSRFKVTSFSNTSEKRHCIKFVTVPIDAE